MILLFLIAFRFKLCPVRIHFLETSRNVHVMSLKPDYSWALDCLVRNTVMVSWNKFQAKKILNFAVGVKNVIDKIMITCFFWLLSYFPLTSSFCQILGNDFGISPKI